MRTHRPILLKIFLWRVYRRLTRRPWLLLVGAVLIAVDLLVLQGPSFYVVFALAAFAVIRGSFEIARPAIEDARELAVLNDTARPGGAPDVRYDAPYDDWIKIARGRETAIHDPHLDEALMKEPVMSIDANEKIWRPPGEYEQLRQLIAPTLDFDENKIRLESDLVANTTHVKVRRTLYSAFVVTNKLAIRQYRRVGERRELLSYDLIALNDDGAIPPFEQNECSNHIGADVIAFMAGQIILQLQSDRNQLNAGKIVGSGSGSSDWRDLAGKATLCEVAKETMRREMTEELGLPAHHAMVEDVRLTGYTRFTELAGKPQFYGVAKLRPVDLRIKKGEALYVADHYTESYSPRAGADGILTALDRIEDTYKDQLAFPLYVGMQMLKQWLTRCPDEASTWILSGPSALQL